MIFKMIITLLPWTLKKIVMRKYLKYDIHPTAYIGFAWIFPKNLIMEKGTKIDHLTFAVNLDSITMKEDSTIGRSNWITGFPSGTDSLHFKHQETRKAELIIGKSSAITKGHHIDCTNRIEIGEFATVAGYQSQLLTHYVNVIENKQDSAPIYIGDYTFVGTNCVILGGSSLPSHSVLGAKSFLNKNFTEEWKIYGGVPAKEISEIAKDAKYFSRKKGYVY